MKYIGDDPGRFAALMQLFLHGKNLITQRATWPLTFCVQAHPQLIKPWFSPMLKKLQQPGNHQAIARNVVRLLQYTPIPKRYQGTVMSICFNYIEDINTPAAVKPSAITILQNMLVEFPEIGPEIQIIIEERWDQETPAFRSRARKLLEFLNK